MKKISDFKALFKKKKEELELRNSPSEFQFSIFDSIHHVPIGQWASVVPEAQGLMREGYLKAIEQSASAEESSKYVLIYQGETPVAAAIFNIILITGEDYGRQEVDTSKLNILKKNLKLRVLICGHSHISGEHGFIYSTSIDSQQAFHALADATYQIRRAEKLKGNIDLVLIKDFDEEDAPSYLKSFSYRQFKVDPNMILAIRSSWTSFDEYLGVLKTKYRKRAKSIFKKGSALESQIFSKSEIQDNFAQIDALYKQVSLKANVRLNHFDTSYFIALKEHLDSKFEFRAYFIDDLIVGFSTILFWGDKCEAHAIGLNYEYNTKHALYQNMLYDFVKRAISSESKELILGRTAMEMKSNLGALPKDMFCFLRHPGAITNRAIKPVFNYIKKTDWECRSPFKEAFV